MDFCVISSGAGFRLFCMEGLRHMLPGGDSMGYRVTYPLKMRLPKQKTNHTRRTLLTFVFLCLFLTIVTVAWPRGKAVLQGMVFSGDLAVTAAALEDMTSDLQAGMPFADALEAFCIHVFTESQLADD